MPAKLIEQKDNTLTIEFTVQLTGQMLKDEQALQQSLNEAGQAAMQPMIKQFDTNGEPIRVNGVKHTVKNYAPEKYETPYGSIQVERHTYQTSKGGRAYVPLEHDARMVLNSTPRYAQIVSGKYTRFGADAICEDLLECNGRKLSRNYAKKLSDYVGTIAQCYDSDWQYDLPTFERRITSVGVSLDGTCILMHNDGWREAMCGSIALYDGQGERLHTIYCSASPEYGKERFKEKFSREILRVQEHLPKALYVGVADGAKDNWSFLKQYTQRQILDFYHASGYIGRAANVIFDKKDKQKHAWIKDWCHQLKHKQGAAGRLIKLLQEHRQKLSGDLPGKDYIERDEELRIVITYFENNRGRMSYGRHLKQHLPLGSGVVEAACKTLVKQRMGLSGSRWKESGASCVLALRSLKLTKGRWGQFWKYIMRHGATIY